MIRRVQGDIEARQPQRHAQCERQHDKPAYGAQSAERPGEDDNCRSDAEIDEIGERIQLRSETRSCLEQPCYPAIDCIENGGQDNRPDRDIVAMLDGHADGGEPGAQCQQREHGRNENTDRHFTAAKTDGAPPLWPRLFRVRRFFGFEWRKYMAHLRSSKLTIHSCRIR